MADGSTGNLAWLSRMMALLSTIGVVASPLILVLVYVVPDSKEGLMFNVDDMGNLLNAAVPLPYRMAAMMFSLIAEAFTVWALWSLRSLFLTYARGEVFSQRAFKLLNNVAVALFAGVIVSFVMHAPISLLLTWPTGHKEISLGFGTGDVVTLFSAGVVLVIARVMTEAGRVADENAKFV